jgi:dipeptidyl aminopeptidase/acylaminoacyl peptidase
MKQARKGSLILLFCALVALGAEVYKKPPQAVLDILNAPMTPGLSLSPTREFAMQGAPVRNPPIAELAEPMLRLAGIRINPKTNGLHNTTFNTTLSLRRIPEGTEIKVDLPQNPKLSLGRWSPDGKRFAFTNSTGSGIELWVGEAATGKTHRIAGLHVNGVMGGRGGAVAGGGRGGGGGGGGAADFQWMPGGSQLLVSTVRTDRGAAPPAPLAPPGPNVQETLGGGRGARTFEDMLQTPHDEDLFEYYATSQLALVEAASGKSTPVGKPGIIESVRVSPDGNYLLVTNIHRPFSYVYPARQFPKEVEVWDRAGKLAHKIASMPLGGGGRGGAAAPGDDAGPPPVSGTRNLQWRPGEAATLMWTESIGPVPPRATPAAGGANGRGNTPPRPDHILALKAPFTGQPAELFKWTQALGGIQMSEKGGLALIENGGGRGGTQRTTQTFVIDLDKPGQEPRQILTRSQQDRYHDPGTPMMKSTPSGERVLLLDGDNIFLTGTGASPEGDHPFLNRFNLTTLKAEPLFRCDNDHYELVEALLDPHGAKFLTRRESPTDPPNYFVRTPEGGLTAVTKFPDPQPQMRNITKQLVTYKRADGVDLSFTLYLPPGYKQGTRLPTVVWAYPREFDDADAAGEVTGSTKRFTEIGGYSQLFFVLSGYAVLDNAAMPIVGDRRTVNDTFVDQVVMDAKAAVDKAVAMGVTDPAKVGVGGHSYGAFMTANLLAHSDIFKAGIAESGAYNRTLTPFGFQNERRTVWQAPEVYLKMSPFMFADKLKAPILFIHGEADDNDGTFPVQSDRMYQAVRGNGGTARLVFLPYEAHGYRARETIEHVLWEKFMWFDKYVKGTVPGTNN